jgi:hypothetical protein
MRRKRTTKVVFPVVSVNPFIDYPTDQLLMAQPIVSDLLSSYQPAPVHVPAVTKRAFGSRA